jgi:hypothetical protein
MFVTKRAMSMRTRNRPKKEGHLLEIEEQIRPLSQAEKIVLIQDIAEMLQEDADERLLQRLQMAAAAADPRAPGLIEAYEAASQLQALLDQENK